MIKLNTDTLLYIAALEKTSGTRVKDCIVTDTEIIYIVDEENLGKAIGKNGQHANKIRNALGKQVRIIGFNADPQKFTRNLIGLVEPKSIILEDKTCQGVKGYINKEYTLWKRFLSFAVQRMLTFMCTFHH